MMESNTRAPAEEMPQWDVGRQPSGKILSLDRREAKKVLEIYVKRSLSCHENSLVAKKTLQEKDRGRGRKTDGLQRSESDFCTYSSVKPSPRKDQEERLKAPDLEETLGDDSKAAQEVPKEGLKAKRKSTKNSSQSKTQRSGSKPVWLKGFLNLFLKKSPEDQKENTGQKAKEKDVKHQGSKPEGAKKHRVDSSTSPALGRALKKKPSLKKVFSLKKHGEEERGEPGSGARSKRPSCLPLRHVLAPAQPEAEQPDGCYTQVSQDIGLIVQGSKSQGDTAGERGEPPEPPGTDGVDEAIKRIVALLRSAGDELDREVREDARLQLFFRDMSYSSFKNLADAYVQRELTASRPNINPQEIQFAYTVHLTATVAGICSQAVNRIMGFGTRYLDDSFAPYGKILQQKREKLRTDHCDSPD
ncbi:apoptosis facilitator Bcl-2-like protein 14 isoform X1 [Pyrgilauda ruficollis]|uniref:apoptosis facilitator Bcl-2-like protein 14 isoform X1 n=1 Tax=Pyrgilauda ruficollis TaxID=221976 RepID=UPI001B865CF7|nr:apoptosis facilitator Bcl-2-like protein 14 isoform X1 [Pyrgilauda ruficollis]